MSRRQVTPRFVLRRLMIVQICEWNKIKQWELWHPRRNNRQRCLLLVVTSRLTDQREAFFSLLHAFIVMPEKNEAAIIEKKIFSPSLTTRQRQKKRTATVTSNIVNVGPSQPSL